MKDFGRTPWFDQNPINLAFDAWGVPAAFVRGLFEYLYEAETLTVLPHLPPSITALDQKVPIRWGAYQLLISTRGCR